jgi:hypothetical protein
LFRDIQDKLLRAHNLKRQWHGIRGGGEEEIVLAVFLLPVRPGEEIYIWTAASTGCVTLWGYSP